MYRSPRFSRSAAVPGRTRLGAWRKSANAEGTSRKATIWTFSPSNRTKVPYAASHRRIALSSMASKTGARSPGEELMTPNTSAIAASRASASSRSAVRASSSRRSSVMVWLGSICVSSGIASPTSTRHTRRYPPSLRPASKSAQRDAQASLFRSLILLAPVPRDSCSASQPFGPGGATRLGTRGYSTTSSGTTRIARVMLKKFGEVAKTIWWIFWNCSSVPSPWITTRLCSSR